MGAETKPADCPRGCGSIAVPILSMNRGFEQLSWEPTHTVGCPACGETWAASAEDTRRTAEAEAAWISGDSGYPVTADGILARHERVLARWKAEDANG